MATCKIVNSIAKGADILRNLSEGVDRISDLSKKLQLSKSIAHSLLKMLEVSELVMQNPMMRHYYPGPLILKLASRPMIATVNEWRDKTTPILGNILIGSQCDEYNKE